MYFVYAIKSTKKNYIYVGLTNNLNRRLAQHNAGKESTTRFYAPFQLILREDYIFRSEARIRERKLKTGSGKEFIKSLI